MTNPTLSYLNGVHSYYYQGQSQSGSGGASSWLPSVTPSVHVPLVLPGLLGGGGGGGHTVNVVATNPEMLQAVRRNQQEDNEASRATTAAWVGGIGTVILSGLSALALRGYCNDRDELQKSYNFRDGVLPNLEPNLRAEMTPIVNEHISILETKTGRARNILILTGAALATGIAAFIGGMMALQWLIIAAIAAAVAIAAIAVFLLVWHCTEKTTITPDMQHNIEMLRMQLNTQQQSMNAFSCVQV